MARASGCRVWDESGREYVDYIMALGAVALGYGHPAVNRAASAAIDAGVVGPLPPVSEQALAAALAARIPWLERVRFLKTGAEAVAAAVRLARVATGREDVLGCGYHGWLDWCQGATDGVPAGVRALFAELPFNDVATSRQMIRERAHRLAAVVIEPVVVVEPTREWLEMLRVETTRAGAVLIFDEIKTAFRLAIGGAVERYGVRPPPDLVVLGKALANGFPLAVTLGKFSSPRPLDCDFGGATAGVGSNATHPMPLKYTSTQEWASKSRTVKPLPVRSGVPALNPAATRLGIPAMRSISAIVPENCWQ